MILNYLKSYGYTIASLIILTFILSIINYLIPIPTFIIRIIIPILSILIGSFILGKKTNKNGYLEGIKFSLIYLIIITIIKLIIKSNFNFKVIIIYLLFIFSGFIGSMLGINFKKR